MAIYKEIYSKTGSNAAQIDANHDWATAFRVRMTDANASKYGACNVFRFVNSSAVDVTISWTWDTGRTESEVIKGNSVRNITADDGRASYGFDIYSAHATTNIAIGEFKYRMAKVMQVPEYIK